MLQSSWFNGYKPGSQLLNHVGFYPQHHNRIYGGSPLNPQYKGMIIFDLLQAIISIFSCLLSYIDIVSENMAAF